MNISYNDGRNNILLSSSADPSGKMPYRVISLRYADAGSTPPDARFLYAFHGSPLHNWHSIIHQSESEIFHFFG
jgi:hypothetical protein